MSASADERVFTCFTCRLVFPDGDVMRDHYKSDLHRFNLKRKVAGLPPVPEAMYQQKVEAMKEQEQKKSAPNRGQQHLKEKNRKRAQEEESAARPKLTAFDEEVLTSTALQKPETESQKLPEESTQQEKTEDEMIDEKIANAKRLTPNDSLFDGHVSASFEENLRYMTKHYSFFIPEIEFLSDIKGLIQYLGEKISIGNTCLLCQKAFYSTEAVQSHMRDVSHCMMLWDDNEEEYADFYDWSNDPRAQIGEDEDEDTAPYHWTEHNELVLQNGKTLGPRQLKVYYDQRNRARSHQQLVTSLMQEHRRLEAIERQKKTYVPQASIIRRQQIDLKTGMKMNIQKHYRSSNPM